MSDIVEFGLEDIPPRRLLELIVAPRSPDGLYVVKNRHSGRYLRLGEQEVFLLQQLDGRATGGAVCAAFAARFGEPLGIEDLRDFVAMARSEKLLAPAGVVAGSSAEAAHEGVTGGPVARLLAAVRQQNPLFFRFRLFDPDRFLTWLEPRSRFVWTREFLVLTALGMATATCVLWVNRSELVSSFADGMRWETFALAWVTMVLVTFAHEFGHGLACKRYGGEVHEIGVLFMFLTPFFYCNVSDAWLLPKRAQRLLVSFAGSYVDLCMWMVAVFLWRLTAQDTLVNHLALVVLSTCGARVLLNFNPLMKLDGYYALSDASGVANLRGLGLARWFAYVRWLLWGAERPERIPAGPYLLAYGLLSWCFSIAFLHLAFLSLYKFVAGWLGQVGIVGAIYLFITLNARLFAGFFGEEFRTMLRKRRLRAALLAAGLVGASCIPISDRVGGPFKVRPVTRAEVRAPVAGFLRAVEVDEGQRVEAGAVLARMEIPDLASQIARKQAELRESQANLRRLEAGPRAEEVAEQRERVHRATAWRDLAQRDLERTRQSFRAELARLDLQIDRARSEFEYVSTICTQAEQLYQQGGLAGQQYLAEKKRKTAAHSEWQQLEAAKRAREAEGPLQAEAELAKREKELADTQATLDLMQAGTRPEEIEAERARLLRLQEEDHFLHEQESKAVITAPVAGMVTTPRLAEKIGTYLEKGIVICLVEDLSNLEAEIAVAEQDASKLTAGEPVTLKARALPFHTLTAAVDRIAPATVTAERAVQGTVTVYCRLHNDDGLLRSGMTGFGRIYHHVRPVGLILASRGLRYVRTEFWW